MPQAAPIHSPHWKPKNKKTFYANCPNEGNIPATLISLGFNTLSAVRNKLIN